MKKFQVPVIEMHQVTYEVEAESEYQAIVKFYREEDVQQVSSLKLTTEEVVVEGIEEVKQ